MLRRECYQITVAKLIYGTNVLFTGACIDHTLLSAQGVASYAKLPSVTVIQGELVSGLTMLTSRTASMLQRHPAHLSALLQQYVKQRSDADGAQEAT